MGLVGFLLHCNESNLVLEILKHDKTWGLASPLQILRGLVPAPSCDLRPWSLGLLRHSGMAVDRTASEVTTLRRYRLEMCVLLYYY